MKTRQKLWLIAITALLLTLLFALCASAEDAVTSGTCGKTASDNVTWSFDSATGTLTISGTGAIADYTKGDGDNPTPWYGYRDQITSVVFSDGITSLGQRTCVDLKKITTCVLPDSVKSIGYGAFSGCSGLKTIDLGDGVTEIGTYAFSGCSKLEAVHIPGSVVTIQNYAFQSCTSMTSVTFEEGVQTIRHGAFNSCKALTEVVLPYSLKTFGVTGSDGVFKDCVNLKEVTFLSAHATINTPKAETLHVPGGATVYGFENSTAKTYFTTVETGVTFTKIPGLVGGQLEGSTITWSFDESTGTLTIGGSGKMPSFSSTYTTTRPWNGYNITKVVVEKGVTSLGHSALRTIATITEVILPEGITLIDQYALKSCTGITHITLPESVTTFNYQALNSCSNLESIVIPKNVTTIGNQVFGGCTGLKTVIFMADSDKTITLGNGDTPNAFGSSLTASVFCNNNASVIAHTALSEKMTCYSTLTPGGNANADGSVTWKFDALSGVMTISGTGAMDNFTSTTAAQSSGWYALRSLVKSMVVEEGVTSLANYGFAGFSALESVSFSSTLTTIGKYAFSSCSALDNVTIGAGVALNDSCFNKCTSLKTLIFEEGAARTAISARVFAGCTALEEVVIPSTVTTFGYNKTAPFNGCTGLKSITFLSKDVTIYPQKDLFAANKETALPAGVIIKAPAGGTVEQYASDNGYTFVKIAPPPLDGGTLETGLTWELSADGVLTISGTGAMPDYSSSAPAPWFSYADSITSIVVSEGVTEIGKRAFNELKKATEVTLPATLTLIDENAFRYCHALIKVNFAESTTELTIGTNAFNQCKVLPTITIPSNVILLGTSSFTQCYAMTTMVFEEGVTAINQKTFNSCRLINNIIFPASLQTLGSGSASAFTNYCNSLTNLTFLNGDTNIIGTFPATAEDGSALTITITAPAGGAVEAYATENGYTFVALGSTPEPDPEPQNPSGAFASGATWEFNPETGLLTISGKGAMDNYSATNEAPWYDFRTSITAVIIENGITTIGSRAFNETKIAAIVIPDSVVSIGESAFRNCKDLASLTIGSGVASIGTYCFNGCSALTSVTVPGNVKSLANYAFNNCTALATIVLEEGVETTSNGTFLGCPITEIVFPKSMLSIGRNDSYSTFAKCTKLEKVIFLNPNTEICTVKEDYISTHGDAIPAGATIYGYAGSTAKDYATAKNHSLFVTMYDPFAYNNNAIMEFTASAVKANAGELLPIVSINRIGASSEVVLPFLAVDENGALYLYESGNTEALVDAEGNAIVLAENTAIAIVYNDKNGTARFYVNRDIPTYGTDEKLAVNVPVATADFLIRSFSDQLVTADGVTVENTFAAEDLPAEFAGFQVGENATALRILAGIDMLYYDSVGFEISLYANGSLVGTKTEYAKTVFTAIRADGETITAEECGFRYIAAVKIFDIDRTDWPADTEVRFVIKTFATIGEDTLYGTARNIYISHDGTQQLFTAYKPAYTGEFIPILRFITSSDVHITDSAVNENGEISESSGAGKLRNAIEQILAYAADAEKNDGYTKLDALLLAGDIVNTGTDKQYENAKYIFGHVSEGGILPDETQLVITMGNHDWGNSNALSYEQALEYLAKFESVFGPATRDTVINGYHFITINVDENLAAKGDNGANMKRPYGYDFSEETVALATQLIEAAVADTPDKPVFVIQHVATSDTILGSWENYETEDGKIGKNDTSDSAVPTLFDLQSKYSNLVVFSGHSHAPINDVASIHQEYFTSLNTGVLGGSSVQSRVDGVKLSTLAETNPNVTVSAGNNDDVYLIEVDAHNRVRIRVWDTQTQNFVGETFMVDSFDPFGFKYTEGRYSDSDIFFDGDAVISEGTISTNAITVTFPMVSADSVVARLYKLVATDAEGNETVGYVAPEYYTGQVAPITTTISGLKPNTDYTLEIYAINPMYSYDIMDKGAIYSEPLTATFTTENDQVVEGGDLITLLLDSKTGTTLNAAGNKVSATVNGTPGVSFDPVIGMDVITFSGDNTQSIAYGFSSVMDKLTDGFSVEAFFKIDEMPTNTVVAFGAMQSCAFGFVLDYSTGTFRFDIHNGSAYKKISSQTRYEANTYYHVVCNFDGTTAYLYVNGVLEGSVALNGNLYLRESHCTLQLGADYKNTGTKIDTASKTTFAKFNLYSDPMTANDVAEAYAKVPHHDAVILEMTETSAAEGGVYGDFGVYVQTSDPSGNYYIRYNFDHAYSTTETGNADSGNDLDMFRIKGAELVEVTEISDTVVTYNVITKVLQDGEIALAIKENGAVDFVGGFHGDEHIVTDGFTLLADGVAYTPGTENKVVVCTTLNINQETVLDRCNTDDQVMTHDQKYTITSAGLNVLRSVEWLVGDFTLQSTSGNPNCYLELFTMYRAWEGNRVCETVSTYDESGNHLGTETIAGAVEKEYQTLNNAGARSAKYTSATSGISATVGFKVIDESVNANAAWIKVRNDDKGDSKWYASFSSVENGLTPAQGEVWEIEAFYHIDYVNPNK